MGAFDLCQDCNIANLHVVAVSVRQNTLKNDEEMLNMFTHCVKMVKQIKDGV